MGSRAVATIVTMLDPARTSILNRQPVNRSGKYVLYWMQSSQRTDLNHALEHAIARGNELDVPTVVCFGLMDDYPEANERHYAFMLEGLGDVQAALRDRGIRFLVSHGNPPEVALKWSRDAALVVCDRGYLRHQRRWRDRVADESPVRVEQVETDVVVPVETASGKFEIAARTLRPKIHRAWERFLIDLQPIDPRHESLRLRLEGDFDLREPNAVLEKLKIDRGVARVSCFRGGQSEALRRLERFVAHRLVGYAEGRNEPAGDQTSTLSPYLHFGNISPVRIALAAQSRVGVPRTDLDALLEELIVRRELASNLCYFNGKYDSYDGIPDWARRTLAEHETDVREHVYSDSQLEAAETHDDYWNAAQLQMNLTGYMHNYMRMYWAKKILEWSPSPRVGFERTLRLNNRLFLDGRDPNSYAGVAWTYGTHDRPWAPARAIFGMVRYMAASGLERKFDIDRYVAKVDDLARSLGETRKPRRGRLF